MKKTAQLLAFLLLVSLAAVSATRRIPWNPTDRPRMQLTQTMQLAHQAVNTKEGLAAKDEKFYCIDATLAVTTSKDGDWTFIFGSIEAGERWVIVDFDGRVTVSKGAVFVLMRRHLAQKVRSASMLSVLISTVASAR